MVFRLRLTKVALAFLNTVSKFKKGRETCVPFHALSQPENTYDMPLRISLAIIILWTWFVPSYIDVILTSLAYLSIGNSLV